MKITDDAGHGGSDPGAVDPKEVEKEDGIYEDEIYSEESDINLKAAKIFKEIAEFKGHEIIMTRKEDKYIPLYQRSDLANKEKTDIFVSFHCNSVGFPTAKGIETLYYPTSKNGKKLAECIQDNLMKVADTPDRGIKSRDNLHVLEETDMPAVLIELGFISNPAEEKLLNEKEYLYLLCEAVLNGVDDYARNS